MHAIGRVKEQVDQWHKIEDLELDPQNYDQLIFDKEVSNQLQCPLCDMTICPQGGLDICAPWG